MTDGYESALDLVVRETPFDYKDLSKECPYTIAQIFDDNFPTSLEIWDVAIAYLFIKK